MGAEVGDGFDGGNYDMTVLTDIPDDSNHGLCQGLCECLEPVGTGRMSDDPQTTK